MEEQFKKHGPFATIVGVMGLLGCFVNINEGNSTIVPTLNLCSNASIQSKTFMTDLPQGLSAATLVLTLVFPIVPILINSKTKWNDFKFDVVKCHVVGQSSVFGVSEVLRHVLTMPDGSFLLKCNISISDCLAKNQYKSLPLFTNGNTSFCNLNNNTSSTDVFNSLHHFPDLTCGIIGSSIVTFLATLYYWKKCNAKEKKLYQASSIQQVVLIGLQIAATLLVLIYVYYLYKSVDYIQFFGFVIGGAIQCFIIKTTLSVNNQ